MAVPDGGFFARLQAAWFAPDLAVFLWLLLPIAWLFRGVVACRRFAFRAGWLTVERLPVPVVVVGNLIVGGAGKTPLTLHIVEALRAAGRNPGIVSRGYGRRGVGLLEVTPGSNECLVGDEPVLLRQRSGLPVFVGRRRAEAGRALLARYPEVDVIVCDDGLQHYALARDCEVVVIDGRGFGNRSLLPAGPLREPVARLQSVDAVVAHGSPQWVPDGAFSMVLQPGRFEALHLPARTCSAEALAGRRLHAIAGIGHPARFFDTLRTLGLTFVAHPFPDHHPYCPGDLDFGVDAVLLMTEKDAVKCRPFYVGEAWVLPVTATVDSGLTVRILEKIDGRQIA